MKLLNALTVVLLLFFSPSILFADEFATIDSTKGAKINVQCYAATAGNVKDKPLLLVHGFNSSAEVWHDQANNYVNEFVSNGYDVIVVDMRGNDVDTNGDNVADAPVVGSSWGYGVRDLGDDVGTALAHGIDYLNNNLPDRNYEKADVITHSAGGLAVTSYSRSLGLISYGYNIDRLIELAPPNSGSSKFIANLKNAGQIIPSVATQTLIAYEHCLELFGGKIWVPGGRGFESENLRKELSPQSVFLKSIEGLGPHPSIRVFIGIGYQDLIVDNWSSVVEERDDIGYEYFAEIGHSNFCNDGYVIIALRDKLEKGEESKFFNRYEPRRTKNTITFLSAPGTGIDHPDDTFDVTTFAKGINVSPEGLFEMYLRIAGRKRKEALLAYWDALHYFKKAQKEIDDGMPEEAAIANWDELLSEKNQILHDNFSQASDEYLECPDIAILANGFYNELAKLIVEKVGEPVRIIDHTFTPSILNDQKLLMIPSGGLSGLSNSNIFKKKLSEFVKNGGTLVCLTQQYGYDFSALPTGQFKGYGWQEDALCYSKAAYIENFHQILSSQDELYPDLKLDGYFTTWPDNAKILLRRSKNLMPAMLMYEFGSGLVIVATIYTDWGHINGQAGLTELNLVRDLVRWSKASIELPVYKPGTPFRQRINTEANFSDIEMILKSPDNTVLERKISRNSMYELGVTLNKSGIYCVDYILYNSDGKIIQPQTEGFYFSFSQPPEGTVENPRFTFTITTDSENYINGAEATFTFHISNNSRRDETIKCKAKFLSHEIEFTESIDVPARSTVSFDKKVMLAKTDRVIADFYSSENSFLGQRERGVNVFEPTIGVSMTTDKMQYAPGQKVLINANIMNNSGVSVELSLVFNIVDSANNQLYYDAKNISLANGVTETWSHEFDIPNDATRGIYKIRLNAFSNSKLVGASSIDVDIPSEFLYNDENLANSSGLLTIEMAKSIFKPNEPILAKIFINNEGEKIESAFLDIRVLPSIKTGFLSGLVTDKSGMPIKGALVNDVYTNDEGKYRLAASKGKFIVEVRAVGCDNLTEEIEILAGEYVLDISLSATKYGDLFGTAEDLIGSYVTLTPVDVLGSDASIRNAVISTDGSFEFRHVPVGTYELNIQPGDIIEEIQIKEGDNPSYVIASPSTSLGVNSAKQTQTLTMSTETEPNNDFDSATEIISASAVHGTIYDYGDEDYFSVNVDAACTLNISVKDVADGLRPHLKIYNSERREIISTAGFSGEEIEYSLEIAAAGVYYLLLKDRYNTFSSLEEYILEVDWESAQDEYEPNNTLESAKEINLGENIKCTIFPKADEDYFTINVEEKGILYIEMQDVPAGLRPSVKIYNSSSQVIAQKGGSSGEKVSLEAEIGESGVYYLLVRDWYSNFSSADPYSFKSYFINTLDEYEPNDSKEQSLLVNFGSSYFGTISTKGDPDFYKLSIPDAGKVSVYLNNVPENIRPYIKLYREGTASWINSVAGAAGEDLTMEFDVDVPSNYFIQIQDKYNSQTSLLRYRLVVVYIPFNEYVPGGEPLFTKTIELGEVVGSKEIDIEIPGFGVCAKYYLQAALTSLQKNSQVVERFYVSDLDNLPDETPVAQVEVSCLEDENTEFNAGGLACFRFKAKNKGTAGGNCKIDFKFMDLFSGISCEFLEPAGEKDLQFEFQLPVDLEGGLYEAEYEFDGTKYIVNFKIAGVKIEVKSEFEDDIFSLEIKNVSAVKNIGLFAEVRCGSFEQRKDFVLMDLEKLSFNILDTDGQEKIYYGIYFSSGKAMHLNSYMLDSEQEEPGILIKIIEAKCNRETDTIFMSWKIDSQGVNLLRLIVDLVAPEGSAAEIINEDIYLSDGLNDLEMDAAPELEETGLYRIVYRFCDAESVVAQASLFFDVGEETRIELRMDEMEHRYRRLLKFTVCCFSSSKIKSRVRLYLDGKKIRVRRVRVDGYREIVFYMRRPRSGDHEVFCTLSFDGKTIQSNKEKFTILKGKKSHCFPIKFWRICR